MLARHKLMNSLFACSFLAIEISRYFVLDLGIHFVWTKKIWIHVPLWSIFSLSVWLWAWGRSPCFSQVRRSCEQEPCPGRNALPTCPPAAELPPCTATQQILQCDSSWLLQTPSRKWGRSLTPEEVTWRKGSLCEPAGALLQSAEPKCERLSTEA